MQSRKIKHKNLTRIDHPAKRTHGYFVRVQWKGERRAKFFSDGVHGDRLAALDAALQWRNDTERELGKPRTDQIVIGTSRSNTGILGVRRRKENGTEYFEATWVAGVTKSGRTKLGRTRYSIARHGEKRALRMAIKARDQHERERYSTKRKRSDGDVVDAVPTA